MKRYVVSLLVFLFAASLSSVAISQTILTVASTAGGTVKTFTLEELVALGEVEIKTGNEFIDGERTFKGPLIRDVLRASKAADARAVWLTAANDYQVEVDPKEFFEYDAILALSMDGQALSRREKGPIWVIYPMSERAELQDPVYNSRLIWQLVKLEYR
jgi:hypothetical protein